MADTPPTKEKKRMSKERRMRVMVSKFQEYVRTYSEQEFYETYADRTFLDDMLYGIGLSMAVGTAIDYTGAGGYERFKQALREHLK